MYGNRRFRTLNVTRMNIVNLRMVLEGLAVREEGSEHSGLQVLQVMMGYSVINPWPSILPPLQDPHVLAMAQRKQVTPSQALEVVRASPSRITIPST